MKRTRAEARKQKRQQSKSEKEAKKAERKEKKAVREAKKAEKAEGGQAGKKRGRKPKKVQDLKDDERDCKSMKVPGVPMAGEEQQDSTPAVGEHVPANAVGSSPVKPRSPHKGLTVLRKAKAAKKVAKMPSALADEKTKKKKKKTGGKNKSDDQGKVTQKTRRTAEVEAEPKRKTRKTEKKADMAKDGNETGEKAPRAARAPRATRQPREAVEVDDSIKTQVEQVLLECSKSNCTHPNFEQVEFNSQTFGIEPYWGRKHAGVKISGEYSHKKPTKGNKCHAAYFGCRSNCTYSNLLLANLYVSCLGIYAIYNMNIFFQVQLK